MSKTVEPSLPPPIPVLQTTSIGGRSMTGPMRNLRAGFTMVEILIAIMVLLVGLVGILVLFPVGINAARLAAQDSMGGVIAESVEEALIDAMHSATVYGASAYDRIEVALIHAGVPSVTGSDIYRFPLPSNVGDSADHPTGSPSPIFLLRPSDLAFSNQDLSRDPFGQYSYQFRVIRRSANLFEYWITAYRNYPTASPDNERILRSKIREYACLISTPAVGVYTP